ncbi:uncharacterized protein LOC111020108 [Momordica charantia]|uniref:Uncharacterized protein LOC111020108 n=1 Tax=Momordica charantia TaxID=3673 RepID=A0A6J1DFT5_MOMCH|nr:uncharacterized protein LOC111020108 [Momordica charantia]
MAGSRSPSVVNRGFLLQRIRSCQRNCPTVDDIIDHLQSNYRDYGGLKRLPFSSIVQRTLESLEISGPKMKKSNKSSLSTSTTNTMKRQLVDLEDQDADRGCENTFRKKRFKRVNVIEQRLQSMETIPLKRMQQSDRDDMSSMSYSDKSGDGVVSMSEEANYGEFDFMNSMLRASYTESNEAKSKNLELDIAIENNEAKRIDVGNEVSKEALSRKDQSCVDNGPRFKDFSRDAGCAEGIKEQGDCALLPFAAASVSWGQTHRWSFVSWTPWLW